MINAEQREDFEMIVKPIIKWINANGHPHMQVIVGVDSAELVEGVLGYQIFSEKELDLVTPSAQPPVYAIVSEKLGEAMERVENSSHRMTVGYIMSTAKDHTLREDADILLAAVRELIASNAKLNVQKGQGNG